MTLPSHSRPSPTGAPADRLRLPGPARRATRRLLMLLATSLALASGQAFAQERPASSAPAFAPVARTADSLQCTQPGNCVSSVGQWAIAPLESFGTPQQARDALMRTLAAFPEARIVREDLLYVETVFTTTLGFRDDVEFVIDPQGQRIDFRSRSQIGLWDIGMNRRRMGALRARFEQMQSR